MRVETPEWSRCIYPIDRLDVSGSVFSPDEMRQVSIRVATCLSHVDDINTAPHYTADGILVRPVAALDNQLKTDPRLFIRRRPLRTSDTYILHCVVQWQGVTVYLRHLTCA